jgi:peptide chain release factor 1
VKDRIERLLARFGEVEELLGSAEAVPGSLSYRELTQEHAYLLQVKEAWEALHRFQKQKSEGLELLKGETDPDLVALIRDEIDIAEREIPLRERELHTLLVPPDPLDHRNVILELRAGTGGDEAALFVGDCLRMYKAYADKKGWKCEPLSAAPSEKGGFKEYIMVISGQNVYRFLRYEAGTHRVQRVPATEAQGRIHTSAVTVAVLPEPDEQEKIVIDERDLKIETFRASGAGGQHVNVTDSAVRITHLPTGTVVACQEERSQHKNRDKAMRILGAKIAEEKRRKEEEAMASLRASQVGTGDRSERIRTYNFPQSRVTDHRIDLTLYNLQDILDGNLDRLTGPLVAYFYQKKLEGEGE